MALDAASTIEIRPGAGSDTNGGGAANTASTNLSNQNSAAYAVTDLVTNGTTTVTSATANWGTDVVDNWMYIAGGSAGITARRYKVVTRTNSSTLVLDKSTGLTAGTGATSNLGGALASVGEFGKLIETDGASGMVGWLKSGTDTLTGSTQNVSGGPLNSITNNVMLVGYSATRGDLNNVVGSASRPVVDAGAQTGIVIITAGQGQRLGVLNVVADGNGNGTVNGFGSCNPTNCTAIACVVGFNTATTTVPEYCSALTCGTGFAMGGATHAIGCFTNDCTTAGYSLGSTSSLVNCISINDAVAVTGGVGAVQSIINCTIHEATGDGISNFGTQLRVINSLFTSNGGDAIDFNNTTTHPTSAFIIDSAFRGNGAVYETSPPSAHLSGIVTPSGDPYENESTDDLRPDSTTGEGAALRAAAFDVYGQTDSRDIGAVQHADPAGSSGGNPNLLRGLAG